MKIYHRGIPKSAYPLPWCISEMDSEIESVFQIRENTLKGCNVHLTIWIECLWDTVQYILNNPRIFPVESSHFVTFIVCFQFFTCFAALVFPEIIVTFRPMKLCGLARSGLVTIHAFIWKLFINSYVSLNIFVLARLWSKFSQLI